MGNAPSSSPDLKTEYPTEYLNERMSSLKPRPTPRERLDREACALFMSDKVGAYMSEEEKEEELGAKMEDYFFNKGPCKELFLALLDCWQSDGTVGEFMDIDMALKKCMEDDPSDYYHPFLKSMKTLDEEEENDIDDPAAAAKQGPE